MRNSGLGDGTGGREQLDSWRNFLHRVAIARAMGNGDDSVLKEILSLVQRFSSLTL